MKFLLLCLFLTPFLATIAMEETPDELTLLLQNFDGRIGVYATSLDQEKEINLNADDFFPMASTRKVILAKYILTQISEEKLSQNQKVSISPEDLVPGTGIIKTDFTEKDKKREYTIQKLLETMMIHSDNTAADLLMRETGGYEVIDNYLQENSIQNIRFGTDIKKWLKAHVIKTALFHETQESVLQSKQAPWYLKCIARIIPLLQSEPTQISFNDETTNIATPRALTMFLKNVYEAKTTRSETNADLDLLSLMKRCETGKNRIPKWLPDNATVYHKTGSGAMGICNDIGIIEEASKVTFVSILIKNSTKPMHTL